MAPVWRTDHQLPDTQENASAVQTPSGKSGWIHAHPYTSALITAVLLVVIGVFVVSQRAAVAPGEDVTAWGGANINLLNPAYSAPQNTAGQGRNDILRQVQNTAPYSYIPPVSSGATLYAPATNGDLFDFNSFIKLLSEGPAAQTSSNTPNGNYSGLEMAYSFIPKGLVSTTTPIKKRTKVEQQLYNYGNEAGSYVESLEEAHKDQAQVLKNWLEDRRNAAKAAAVVQLGRAMWETGQGLSSMESVPTEAKQAHDALAKSYMDIGANLALVAKTEGDVDLLKTIEVYNASADIYAKNYIALVNIFGAYGVGFSADDTGHVFTFTQVSL